MRNKKFIQMNTPRISSIHLLSYSPLLNILGNNFSHMKYLPINFIVSYNCISAFPFALSYFVKTNLFEMKVLYEEFFLFALYHTYHYIYLQKKSPKIFLNQELQLYLYPIWYIFIFYSNLFSYYLF